jgi:hypothetical protein
VGRVGRAHGDDPAFVSTRWDAVFALALAALSVRSPYRAAATRHSSWTVAVATPRPAACWATRNPSSAVPSPAKSRLNRPSTEPSSATSTWKAPVPASCSASKAVNPWVNRAK